MAKKELTSTEMRRGAKFAFISGPIFVLGVVAYLTLIDNLSKDLVMIAIPALPVSVFAGCYFLWLASYTDKNA